MRQVIGVCEEERRKKEKKGDSCFYENRRKVIVDCGWTGER